MKVKTISKWKKDSKICSLVSVRENGGDTKYCFIGWNPMPVKGWFDSSYGVLNQWLRENGWTCISGNVNVTIIIL